MFTLSYHEDAQDSREFARGLPPLERTIRLIARLNAPRMLSAKTRQIAWEAFQEFRKPERKQKYFDLGYLQDEMGKNFEFCTNFRIMTGRTAGRRRGKSIPGSLPETMIGFSVDIIVKSKGEMDASNRNIGPLLDAIAAAADRKAHDRDLGHFISIDNTVPLIGANRPRPLPPSLRPRSRQPRPR